MAQKKASSYVATEAELSRYASQNDDNINKIMTKAHALSMKIIFSCFIIFFIWANLTEITHITRGTGRIVPLSENQVIQHLEGGIIRDIFVKEGDKVEKGQPLMRIENGLQSAEYQQAELEINAKFLRKIRLRSEIEGKEDFFPPKTLHTKSEFETYKDELSLFLTRKGRLESNLHIFDEKYKQKELELSELKSRFVNIAKERAFLREQVQSLKKLTRAGAFSKNKLLEEKRNLQQIESRLSDLTHAIPRTKAALEELRMQKEEISIAFRMEAKKELSDVNLQISKLQRLVTALNERKQRNEIVAPLKGAVNKLYVSTIGGVVKGGEILGQIVPDDPSIAVEARISPEDRAEIFPGQKAIIKISAYDYTKYGGLEGKVVEISPDALQDDQNKPFFRVRLEAKADAFGEKYRVVPGMIADVDILTGSRTIMEALIRPVKILGQNALRE